MTRGRFATVALGMGIAGILLSACSATQAGSSATTQAASGSSIQPSVTPDAKIASLLPARYRGGINVASGIYAPMEMLNSSQQFTGFDYDLGQALGIKLGVKFTFTNQAFDSIIPSLQSGQHDIIMYGMNDTLVREKSLYFVDYFHAGMEIVVKKGNPEKIGDVLDLCGKSVAVAKATTQADLMRAEASKCEAVGKKPITVIELPSEGDALIAVRAGNATADVLDAAPARYNAATAGNGAIFEVVNDPAEPTGIDPVYTGIGVLRQNHDLVAALQTALDSLVKDGVYQQLLKKYDLSAYGVTSAIIDGAS